MINKGLKQSLTRVFGLILLAALTNVCQAQVDGDPRANLDEAEFYYTTHDYDRSLDILYSILAADFVPERLRRDTQVLMARDLARLGQPEAAVSAFKEVLAVDPNWQPDRILLPADETALFDEALVQHQMEQRELALSECPSQTTPLIVSAGFAATSIYFMFAKRNADDLWNEYEAHPDHPATLFNEYESAKTRQDIAAGVAVASGLATGYLWYRYVKRSKACKQDVQTGVQVGLGFGPNQVMVVGRF